MSGVGRRVRCLYCREIVQSKHHHDFVGCSCFNARPRLTTCCDAEAPGDPPVCACCGQIWPVFRGVAVDGGEVYTRIVGDCYTILDDETEDEPCAQ